MNKSEETQLIEDAIRRSRFYKGSETFQPNDFTGGYLPTQIRRDISSKRIAQILHVMVLSGEIEKTGPSKYRRTGGAREWISRPWRRHTNAELGVVSRQFGVMA